MRGAVLNQLVSKKWLFIDGNFLATRFKCVISCDNGCASLSPLEERLGKLELGAVLKISCVVFAELFVSTKPFHFSKERRSYL